METGEKYYIASLLFVIINRLHKNNKDNKIQTLRNKQIGPDKILFTI